jgi:hypothetical protein
VSDKQWRQIVLEQYHNGRITSEELDAGGLPSTERDLTAPASVTASLRLADDVEALLAIFESTDNPPLVNVRSKKILTVIYGFGDASGSGLGSTFTCGAGFTFRIGVWGQLNNLNPPTGRSLPMSLKPLKRKERQAAWNQAEIFMFTDNSTVESCAEKGSSSSKKLLRLIVRLHSLATRLGVKIHIFHVAGTRMIAQGTDGVSRGYLAQGVMAGEAMKVHIPIYLSAVDRSSQDLVTWIQSWSDPHAELLKPIGWFQEGHDIEGWVTCSDGFDRPKLSNGKIFIWAPPRLQQKWHWQN